MSILQAPEFINGSVFTHTAKYPCGCVLSVSRNIVAHIVISHLNVNEVKCQFCYTSAFACTERTGTGFCGIKYTS